MAQSGPELLRFVAGAAWGSLDEGALPAATIRFTLEYSEPPDLASEFGKIGSAMGPGDYILRSGAIDGPLLRFLVLQFPGLARTLSAGSLFKMADVFVEVLHLVSCEPDLGTPFYAEPYAASFPLPVSEGTFIDALCWSAAAPPSNMRWALQAMGALDAWATTRGAGIVIAQPDTGVAPHPELDADALLFSQALNVLDGSANVTDPLSPDEANPGHGTATASVAVSRVPGLMAGSAPEAWLVPIRCIVDVKIFDAAPVAAAVDHAVRIGAQVVTMSLGGLPSAFLGAAIDEAVARGLIVLAAAGNCTGPFVVFPARDRRVIAVAGVDVHDRPWKGTAHGPQVAISAPAENVYVARRTPVDAGQATVLAGQGTSFATALVAGAAALWLSRFGHDRVVEEAAKRCTSVQELFRAALQATARVPVGWKEGDHGAGVIDAAALVAMPLDKIRLQGRSPETPRRSDLDVVLDHSRGRPAGDSFAWGRYGNAASYFALQAVRRSGAVGGIAAESEPFESHLGLLPAEIPNALRRLLALGESIPVSFPPEPAQAARVATDASATVAEKPGYVSGVDLELARTSLLQPGRLDPVAELTRRFDALDAEPGASGSYASELRRQAMSTARQAMARLGRGGGAGFTPAEDLALEALIRVRDRVAIRVRNGTIELTPESAGEWFAALLGVREYLTSVIGSVGRIDVNGHHIGTGTVVAPGTLLTNRHVAEGFADGIRGPDGQVRWFMTQVATINFDEDAAEQGSAFAINGVIAADPDRSFSGIRLTDLDLALVSVEAVNRAGNALPNRIDIVAHPKFTTAIQDVFVVGYPARPGLSAITDPRSGLVSMPLAEALAAMFGASYGVKYLSPGRMTGCIGDIARDTRRWVFSHDATTLGGSSGSGAFLLGEPRGMLGLHFSGSPTINNYAHSLAAVRESGAVPLDVMTTLSWV